MILSKENIMKNRIEIKPFRKKYLGDAFYELHLGNNFMYHDVTSFEGAVCDMKEDGENILKIEKIEKDDFAYLPPKGFIIAYTEERISVHEDLVLRVTGSKFVTPFGFSVSVAADSIKYDGKARKLRLEIYNASPYAVKIYPGLPIANAVFEEVK